MPRRPKKLTRAPGFRDVPSERPLPKNSAFLHKQEDSKLEQEAFSSATMKIGGPPVEMETALARVSCAFSEAAHACRTDM
jgi:hypothetical protein